MAVLRDLRDRLPVLTGDWDQLTYHSRPVDRITGVTLHYTAGPAAQTAEAVAAYQTSLQAAAQTGAGQPFPGIAYTLFVTADGVVDVCHDLGTRVWHSGAVVQGVARNASHVGICYAGNDRPNAAQVGGIAAAIDYCEQWLNRRLTVEGHKDAMSTTCPGPAWPAWKGEVEAALTALRGGAMPTEQPRPSEAEVEKKALGPAFRAAEFLYTVGTPKAVRAGQAIQSAIDAYKFGPG